MICKSTNRDEGLEPLFDKTATSSIITRLTATRDTRSFDVMNDYHDQLGAPGQGGHFPGTRRPLRDTATILLLSFVSQGDFWHRFPKQHTPRFLRFFTSFTPTFHTLTRTPGHLSGNLPYVMPWCTSDSGAKEGHLQPHLPLPPPFPHCITRRKHTPGRTRTHTHQTPRGRHK